jgi:hypothetical protein
VPPTTTGTRSTNERYAQRHFSNTAVVGQRLTAKVRGDLRDLEIVGVVRNARARSLRGVPPATVYVVYQQLVGDVSTTVEVRAAGPVAPVATALRRALQTEFPTTPIEVRPLSALRHE